MSPRERERYFTALINAIDASGISPGFARVGHQCKEGFEIILTVPQIVIDNWNGALTPARDGRE